MLPTVGAERKQRRVSLAGLLLVPLVISPALLGIRFALDTSATGVPGPNETPVMELFVVTGSSFVYATILVVFSYRRRSDWVEPSCPFVWCLLRGALFGGLFGLLVSLPSFVTLLVSAWDASAGSIVHVTQLNPDGSIDWVDGYGHLILDVSHAVGVILLLFTLIGAAAGGVVGLLVRRKTNWPVEL